MKQILKHVKTNDEMEQRIQEHSMANSYKVVNLAMDIWCLVEIARVAINNNYDFNVFPFIAALICTVTQLLSVYYTRKKVISDDPEDQSKVALHKSLIMFIAFFAVILGFYLIVFFFLS